MVNYTIYISNEDSVVDLKSNDIEYKNNMITTTYCFNFYTYFVGYLTSYDYNEWNNNELYPTIGFKSGDLIHIVNNDINDALLEIMWGTNESPNIYNFLLHAGQNTWIFVQDPINNTNNFNYISQITTINDDIHIQDIKAGNFVLDYNNNPILVHYNIKYTASIEYILISKNALADGLPNNDLLIRHGHPIMLNGKETDPSILVNEHTITNIKLNNPEHYWILCTRNRTFVMINGIPVCTWSKIAWENFIKNDNHGKTLIYTIQ